MRYLRLLAVLTFMIGLAQGTAYAQESPPGGICGSKACPVDANAESRGDTIRATVTNTKPAKGVSDKVPRGTPATHGDAPGRREWKTLEEVMAPACTGNTRTGGADALCPGAFACPALDQLRWWVWQRETAWSRDDAGVTAPPVVGEWYQLPGSYCLGDDDPGVPTIGRVIAQVQTGFQDLPLPVAALQVDPAPTSLVNVPTAFFAGGQQSATFTPTILGTTVTINAKPTQWVWTWGDGTSTTTTTPGVPKRPVVAHEYEQAGDVAVSVATTWTGTFTVAGSSEVFPIRTPAVVQSAPVTVQVREARTELVDQ